MADAVQVLLNLPFSNMKHIKASECDTDRDLWKRSFLGSQRGIRSHLPHRQRFVKKARKRHIDASVTDTVKLFISVMCSFARHRPLPEMKKSDYMTPRHVLEDLRSGATQYHSGEAKGDAAAGRGRWLERANTNRRFILGIIRFVYLFSNPFLTVTFFWGAILSMG